MHNEVLDLSLKITVSVCSMLAWARFHPQSKHWSRRRRRCYVKQQRIDRRFSAYWRRSKRLTTQCCWLSKKFFAGNIAPAGRKNRRTFASGQLAKAIFTVLKRLPHPLSSREIAEQVAADCGKEQDIHPSVAGSLREQFRRGRVERVKDGMGGVRWRMAFHAAAAKTVDETGAPLRLCKSQ